MGFVLLSDEPHLHFIGRTGRHEPDKLTPFYSLYFTRLQLYQWDVLNSHTIIRQSGLDQVEMMSS